MYERILIAVDGSQCSIDAVREGVRIAESNASLVTLLYVIDEEDARPAREHEREANTAIQGGHLIASKLGVIVTDRIARGIPVMEIVREAESFDLIVMGSHGKGLLRHAVLGAVTKGVLSHLHRPVLIVPPAEDLMSRRSSIPIVAAHKAE